MVRTRGQRAPGRRPPLLEIELDRLRGRPALVALLGFGLSFGLALVVGFGLKGVDLTDAPLLIAIILSATALGVIVPLLKDSGEISSDFGQLVIAGASIADFGAIILLTLFFSRESTGTDTKLVLLGGFALVAVAGAVALSGIGRSMRLSALLTRLQDTTAQIRVRGAFLLLVAFVVLAEELGLEVILGAFMAGAILRLVDTDEMMTHPQFRLKLESIGFGVFVPIFFVTSGLRFNLDALFASTSTIVLVPIFLAALLVVRGVPAVLYRPLVGGRRAFVAGLLQATSLTFIVAATQIGMELGELSEAISAAMIAAGLLSVLIFPIVALTMLRMGESAEVASRTGSAGGAQPATASAEADIRQ